MKIKGTILTREVIVFIYTRVSHNFISMDLIVKPMLTIQPTLKFKFIIGSRYSISSIGICPSISLMIQGIKVTDNFLNLPLGNIDCILGMEWRAYS